MFQARQFTDDLIDIKDLISMDQKQQGNIAHNRTSLEIEQLVIMFAEKY